MIRIDDVYQKVLTLANKEQRGYITPQEFNLLADLAQKEIFEQYFYDMNQWNRQPGNQTSHSDMRDILEGKISAFEFWAVSPNTNLLNNYGDINLETNFPDIYRLVEVRVNYGGGYKVAEEMTTKEFRKYDSSPLVTQSKTRPVYMHYFNGYDRIKIYPWPTKTTPGTSHDDIRISYIRTPSLPKWGYVVVQEKALYDPGNSVDFELHKSDESELVYKILKLAGINLDKTQVTQSGGALEASLNQSEKQ